MKITSCYPDPTGRRLLVTGRAGEGRRERHVFHYSPETGEASHVASGLPGYFHPAWSPGGEKVAARDAGGPESDPLPAHFGVYDVPAMRRTDVRVKWPVYAVDWGGGSELYALVRKAPFLRAPRFSVLQTGAGSAAAGGDEVAELPPDFVADAAGPGSFRAGLAGGREGFLAAGYVGDGRPQLVWADRGGGGVRVLDGSDCLHLRLSPSRHSAAYLRRDAGVPAPGAAAGDLVHRDLAGDGEATVLERGVELCALTWRGEAEALYCARGPHGSWEVTAARAGTGEKAVLFSTGAARAGALAGWGARPEVYAVVEHALYRFAPDGHGRYRAERVDMPTPPA